MRRGYMDKKKTRRAAVFFLGLAKETEGIGQ